ncbi:Bifunctional epoxide hydrolase 2 [Colletotrichum sidae]|uniref:Bifunctional epoxide hydrolase 2 n=1 Tax=Colletotrichum sidae TaxID=1347389 RepID=A0A4R8TTK1_9PEZI|nr:Bifunctional epoxide hydrolase 2 [Colletotrichum sidae]
MDLSQLEKKTLEVSRGLTYTYYTSPAKDSKPTIALFHGWPDSAELWAQLINDYLVPDGYGVLAQDNLGFGDSSKPTDPAAYSWDLMTGDIIQILDAERLPAVIAIGHDWGSGLSQRLYNFHPSRVAGLALLQVPYSPPTGQDFDYDGMTALLRQLFGHECFGYWLFFGAADSPRLMGDNLDSVHALLFGSPDNWIEHVCARDGFRNWVAQGRTRDTLPFADGAFKARFVDRLSRGGFTAPNCWYRANMEQVMSKADRLVPDENKALRVPVLFWLAQQDPLGKAELLQPSIEAGLLPNLKVVKRDGGHWGLLEHPDVVGKDVLDWLKETAS